VDLSPAERQAKRSLARQAILNKKARATSPRLFCLNKIALASFG